MPCRSVLVSVKFVPGAASSEVKVEENQETLESAPEESEVDRTSVRFQFPTGRRVRLS